MAAATATTSRRCCESHVDSEGELVLLVGADMFSRAAMATVWSMTNKFSAVRRLPLGKSFSLAAVGCQLGRSVKHMHATVQGYPSTTQSKRVPRVREVHPATLPPELLFLSPPRRPTSSSLSAASVRFERV